MSADRPRVSVILPTVNEAENLALLVPRIGKALAGRAHEIVVVDDGSEDATAAVCAELAREHPVRLLVRAEPRHGLSGAVLFGMAAARGEYLVVMDADLQHPPERLPAMLAPLEASQADFVLGSRYVPGGSLEGSWGPFRRLNSWIATVLARPFARGVRDPMSGFLALRRSTFEGATRLTPLGYKIGLELMSKCPMQAVVELPFHFGVRIHGQSKLTLTEQFRYLEHLSRLYDFRFPRASPIAKFSIVVALGWLLAAGVALAIRTGGAGPALATVLAYPAFIAVTAIFFLRYVRAQREFLVTPRPWRDFLLISALEWLTAAGVAVWASWRLDRPSPGELFVLSFGCATVVRYVLRKELLQDVRGLRRDPRPEDLS
ncbi:MAG: polyprenol monophosphomannose synthase [Candidatus Rokuibacteriota bacterium]